MTNKLKVGDETFNVDNRNSILNNQMSTRSIEEENALEMLDPLLKLTPGPGAYYN